MSFTASPDRILITASSGETIFDTNNRMPSFVSTLTNSFNVTFPNGVFVGFAGGGRVPPRSTFYFNNWSQDYYIGAVPSGLSLFGYMQLASTVQFRSKFMFPTPTADTTSGSTNLFYTSIQPIDGGNYGAFQSTVCEMLWRGHYGNTSGGILTRYIELVFYGGAAYLRATQKCAYSSATPLSYPGWTINGMSTDTLVNSNSYTSYDFTVTANIGVVP